jgi:hypothetical protein
MSLKYSTIPKLFYFPLWPCSQIWQSHLVSDHRATHLTNLIQKTLVSGTERTSPNSQKPNNSPKYESFLNSSHSLNRFSPNPTGSTTGLLNCTVFTLCFGHSKHVQHWHVWSERLGGRGGKRYRGYLSLGMTTNHHIGTYQCCTGINFSTYPIGPGMKAGLFFSIPGRYWY